MTAPESRKEILQFRNAQTVFLRKLRNGGVVRSEIRFRFLDYGGYWDRLEKQKAVLNSAPYVVVASREIAVETLKKWLGSRPGELLCWVRDVGAMSCSADELIEDIHVLDSLIGNFLSVTSTDITAGCAYLRTEYGYRVMTW